MNDQPFTFQQLQKTIEALTPVLYYGLSEFAERGQVYVCKATEWNQQFVILHPDDFEQFKQSITPVRLVHLRDESKESMAERIMSRLPMRCSCQGAILKSE